MGAGGSGPSSPGAKPDVLTPEDVAVLDERLARIAEEKRAALLHPGLTWREWFYFDAMKWWIGLGCLIADTWVAAFWLEAHVPLLMVPSLAAALYAEFLLFRYLWTRPEGPIQGRRFRKSWLRPVEVGRWTPEGEELRAGVRPSVGEAGVPSEEFL